MVKTSWSAKSVGEWVGWEGDVIKSYIWDRWKRWGCCKIFALHFLHMYTPLINYGHSLTPEAYARLNGQKSSTCSYRRHELITLQTG